MRKRAVRAAWALLALGVPRLALASIGGNLETAYTHGSAWSEDSSGSTTSGTGDLLRSRVNLGYSDYWYPLLNVRAGGTFDGSRAWTENDGEKSESKSARLSSYADMNFGSPFVRFGAGYNYLQRMAESGGESAPIMVRETYQANLGFRPQDLPDLQLQALRTYSFDRDRALTDTRSDSVLWSSRYAFVRGGDLSYQGAYNRSWNNLKGTDVTDLTNSARMTYGANFLRGRANVSTSYTFSRQDTDTRTGKTAEFAQAVPRQAGLSSADSRDVTNAQLDRNPALVNGVVGASDAPSGIDLGLRTDAKDRNPRQIGLDLGFARDVNSLYVYVAPERELTSAVAQSFTWRVFTSDDPDGAVWRLHQSVGAAPLVASPSGDFRFEVRFTSVRARYVKLEVSPLSPTVPDASNYPSIPVTELEAYDVVPASEVKGHTDNMSQTFNLTSRALLLDNPSLTYNFGFFFTNSFEPDTARYSLVNALSAGRRLSDRWDVSARVGREDSVDPDNHSYNYSYSASLTGTPLPTLSHSLVYSGRWRKDDQGSGHSDSLSLSNTATLYRGVDLSVSGLVTRATLSNGGDATSENVSVGVALVPHPKFSVNATYTQMWGSHSGGDQGETSENSRSADVSATWSPTSALYLFASLGYTEDTAGVGSRTQSYSAGWSPLRGGALQLTMNYTENLRSEGNARDRSFSPSLRWNIGPKMSADVTYAWATADSDTTRSGGQSVNVLYRASF